MIKTKYPTTKPSLNLDFANTKSLDPRITFRRGTPGTYYDGVTHAKAEENLLSYSEDFSQWGYGRIVQTSGQSAPDGSSTAYKIEQESGQTSSGYLLQTYNTSANKSYTFSVYAKAGTNRNYVVLRTYLSNNRFTYFDLANGVVGNVDEGHIAGISDAGNGWYRCSITYTPISTSSVQFNVYFSDNNSSVTVADDGGFIYLWGAQLEQRDSVTAYTSTMRDDGTSAPITKYQPKLMTASPDDARFDHDPITGESKGLLIEEQRTNLVTYSEDFSQWDRPFNVTVTSNTVVAPDGTLTGDLIIPSTSAEEVYVGQQSFNHPSSLYSTTVYVKYAGIQWIGLHEAGGYGFVYFDILNGVVGDNKNDGIGTITSIGNGWFRCSVFRNTATTSRFVRVYLCDANGSNYCTASGIKGIYVWGAQVEAGSFATSYIKTTGASATRSADNASITGENFSSWYRQDEGSIYADILPNYAIHYGTAALTIGTTQDSLSFSPGGKGQVRFFIRTNDVSEATIDRTGYSGYNLKLSASYASDYAYFSVNGQTIGEDTSVLLPSVDTMRIGQDRFGSEMCAHIKKISYYPQRLTNEQLQNLTK